jgi:hypothetical protein
VLLPFATSCGSDAGDAVSAIRFVESSGPAGLDIVTDCGAEEKRHIIETLGSGVALSDYDNDGDVDLYVATAQTVAAWRTGEGRRANALYRNDGAGTFTDVAAAAGVDLKAWAQGTYFVDYDNDGDRDLFVTTWGPNVLYRNEGDGTFTDVSASSGLGAGSDWSTGAAFGDLDGDGDLDLYVASYCEFDLENPPFDGTTVLWQGIRVLPGPQGLRGVHDRLYRNDGDGTFSDVSSKSGILDIPLPHYGLGVVFSDFDLDGDLDVYVANDSVDNALWRNEGGLRFTDVAPIAGVSTNEAAKQQAGMGTDSGDYDGDGRFDLFVTNFSHDYNTLYRNDGGLIFTDTTFQAGFSDGFSTLCWGTRFADFDHDGRLDLFVANGHVYPEVDAHPQLGTTFRQADSVYRNRGDGTFENLSRSPGSGLDRVESTRGVATADIDDDGDLDVVATHIGATPSLLLNHSGDAAAWVVLRLTGRESNRDAVGAVVEIEAGGRRQTRAVNPFGSFLSQSSYDVHFGLGDAERIERAQVRWPSGSTDELAGLETGRIYLVTEGTGVTGSREPAGDNR